MKYTIGIDIGGSTTKIVGFNEEGELIQPFSVKAGDPITSTYGAFGRFTCINGIALEDIARINMTGVGSSYITTPIYGIKCEYMQEFSCVGHGGLYLSGLDDCIVVSMGTGTSMTHAKRTGEIEYLGGTGVGGGTLMGLSKILIGMENIEHICRIASEGDLHNVDLRIADIMNRTAGMPGEMTAANFGKISDMASDADIALGIINMVFETIAMCSIFAARRFGLTDIILTGNLTGISQANDIFSNLGNMFGMNFIIPKLSQYGPVIGAALG